MKLSFKNKEERVYGAEFKPIQSLRLIYFFMIGLIFFGVGSLSFFIYRHVYQAFEEINAIVVLKSEIGIETINFTVLSDVQQQWKEKFSEPSGTVLRNPFSPASAVNKTRSKEEYQLFTSSSTISNMITPTSTDHLQ